MVAFILATVAGFIMNTRKLEQNGAIAILAVTSQSCSCLENIWACEFAGFVEIAMEPELPIVLNVLSKSTWFSHNRGDSDLFFKWVSLLGGGGGGVVVTKITMCGERIGVSLFMETT